MFSLNSVPKSFYHYSKRVRTRHLLCERPGSYRSASKTQVRDRIFKLTPIHASVIYQILRVFLNSVIVIVNYQ